MRNRGIHRLVFFAILLVYTLSFVSSVNIGISPASVHFKNVMRDGFAEKYIVVSADSEEKVLVSVSSRGEISDWLNVSESEFYVSRDNPHYFSVSVSPPGDVSNGNYSGFLEVRTSAFSDSLEDHAVGKVLSSLDLLVDLEVVDFELIDCDISNLKISSVEEGDELILSFDISNKGNVRINPDIFVDVWDRDQVSILKENELRTSVVFPTREREESVEFSSSGLDIGQYWAEVSIPECLSESLLTFDILERGALKADGILLNILSRTSAKKGEVVAFEVSFKNTGEKRVNAKFKGEARLNGRIVDVFDNIGNIDVDVGEIEKFNFFFTPKKPGKYVISGRVYYDGKKTFEQSRVLNVEGGASGLYFVYGGFLALILILYYKIRKEKVLYEKKMRMFK